MEVKFLIGLLVDLKFIKRRAYCFTVHCISKSIFRFLSWFLFQSRKALASSIESECIQNSKCGEQKETPTERNVNIKFLSPALLLIHLKLQLGYSVVCEHDEWFI